MDTSENQNIPTTSKTAKQPNDEILGSGTATITENDSEELKSFKLGEYDKVYDTYQSQITTIIQIVSAFVTVNATILGIGITFQRSWLFLVGALVSTATALVILNGERATRPFILRALQLESELGEGDSSIVSLWVGYLYGVDSLRNFQVAANGIEIEEKIASLADVTSRFNSNKFLVLVYLVIVIQILLAIFLPILSIWAFI